MSGISLSGNPAPSGQPTTPTTPTTPLTPTTPTTPPAAAPGSTGSPAVTPPAGTSPAWYSSIQDAELKGFAEKKNWASAEAQLKSHMELEKAFSAKQGPKAPATVNDYKLDVPTDFPQGAGYSNDFATAFRAMAHKADLSQEQAAALHGAYLEFAKTSFSSQSEAHTKSLGERITKASGELEKTLGKQGSPAFNRNIELAKRAIRMTDPGMMDALKESGVIVSVDGQDMVANSKLFGAFVKMGQSMYAEDTLYGQPADNVNPFDAKTSDPTAQAWLMKNDPDKAKLLIRAAGGEAATMFKRFLEGK